jgi:uroporphyrinogen III methyltransferase/synthase
MPSLAGRRIVVTRRAGQSSSLVSLLQARGAEVVEVPSIEIRAPEDTRPLDEALRDLGRFRWLVFTSANAVEAVRARLGALELPQALTSRGSKLASVGAATTTALRTAFPADLVALQPTQAFEGGELARVFAGEDLAGARVLVPCSSRARDELARGLRALGADVLPVVAYETVEPRDLAPRVARCLEQGFDLALFASPSAVESFAQAAGARVRGLPAVAIGPTTAEAARKAGLELRGVAAPSTAEGLVRAAERALGG